MCDQISSEKAGVLRRLDERQAAGRRISFWWRDDDAVEPTPALGRLIGLSEKYQVPVALAVIPRKAKAELSQSLRFAPLVTVLQHGWSHKNHADKEAGERASEFGIGRALHESLSDARAGHRRLAELFEDRFMPVFVPPWNRASEEVIKQLGDAGLVGYSAFGSLFDPANPHRVDGHVDPIKWKPEHHFVGAKKTWRKIAEELDRRAEDDLTPIGLLTHHLGHDDALWAFLDECLELLSSHPAVDWPHVKALFSIDT